MTTCLSWRSERLRRCSRACSRGARSSFSGREGALSLGGDVRTTMVGADYAKGPLVAGRTLSSSGSSWNGVRVDPGLKLMDPLPEKRRWRAFPRFPLIDDDLTGGADQARESSLADVEVSAQGIVKLTLRPAQCRDEHSPAPLPSASLSARHHQPCRLALPQILHELPGW